MWDILLFEVCVESKRRMCGTLGYVYKIATGNHGKSPSASIQPARQTKERAAWLALKLDQRLALEPCRPPTNIINAAASSGFQKLSDDVYRRSAEVAMWPREFKE